MKINKLYSAIAFAAVLGLTACEKESSFLFNEGEGQLNCEKLSVDYINSGREVRAEGINVNDFTVNFVKSENGAETTVKSYTYGEMPQVVSLPKGSYKAVATFGENPVAGWECPYYLGNTSFVIKEGEITNDVDPVECKLSNIRIRVNIDDLGLGLLGPDVKVVVTAGNEGMLTYDESTNNKSGYFRYVDGSQTIVASFSGTVDGVYVDNVRRYYDNAKAGNAYGLTFTITKPDNVEPGNINITDGGIQVDATITIVDLNKKVNPGEDDEILEDDMRPQEEPQPDDPDNPDDPDDPNNPDNPDDPTPGPSKGPQIIMTTDDLVLDQCGEAYAGKTKISFKVTSETGITDFLINIDSTTLTPEELEGVGLGADIDLVNPGDFGDSLSGLGFKVGDEVKGQKEVEFDISGFIGLMNALGEGEHKFNLTVSDASGTTKGIIWFKNIKQ